MAVVAPHRVSPTEGLPRVINQKYRLERRVGEGTYGVVYKATQLATGEIFAIKEMRPDPEEEGFPSSALREIAVLLELKHSNVVRLFEVIREPGAMKLYLVFEYVDLDLHRLMELNPYLGSNPKLVKYYVYQMLLGLEYCHRRRIMHRDLKPQNLLISRQANRLKVADFGLSRPFGVPIRMLSPEVITLWYRPPELLLGGRSYSTAVDIWSAGCIIVETVNRWPLFPGQTEIDEIHKIFQVLGTPSAETWPEISDLPYWRDSFPKWQAKTWDSIVPRLDPKGRDLVSKMLIHNPTKRISATLALKHPYFSDIDEILANPPPMI